MDYGTGEATMQNAEVNAKASERGRTLRLEFRGRAYDWLDLDELGEAATTLDFVGTLRENMAHYFGVPIEFQVLYDDDVRLPGSVAIVRLLLGAEPKIRLCDSREMEVPAQISERTPENRPAALREVEEAPCDAIERIKREVPAQILREKLAQRPRGETIDPRELQNALSPRPLAAARAPEEANTSMETVVPSNGHQEPCTSPSKPQGYGIERAARQRAGPELVAVPGVGGPFVGAAGTITRSYAPAAAGGLAPPGAVAPVSVATPYGSVTPQLLAARPLSPMPGRLQVFGNTPERPVTMAYAQGQAPVSASPRTRVLPTGAEFRSVSPRMMPGRTTVVTGPLSVSRSGTPVQLRATGNMTPSLFPAASPAMLHPHAMPSFAGPPSPRWATPPPVNHHAAPGPFPRSLTPPPPLQAMPLHLGHSPRLAPSGAIVDYSLPQSAVQQGIARGMTPVRSSTPPPLALHPLGAPSGSIMSYAPTAASYAPVMPAAYQLPGAGGNSGQIAPASGVIEVQLTKSGGADRFGFANIPAPDGRGLLVSWIDGAGLLAQWSRAHPAQAVCEGDRIVGVNGAWEDQDAMRSHLERDRVVMHIERS